MNHTYTLSGMTCGNCAARVKNELLKNPDVTSVEVTLDPPQAVISMNRHLALDTLQAAISKAGGYTISAVNKKHSDVNKESIDNTKTKPLSTPIASGSTATLLTVNWLKTYKPILLIFAFIMGISFLTSYRSGTVHPVMFMNTFMAGFFLVFSFFKFLDLKSFANSYAMYDLLAMRSKVYAFLYPFIELALGLAYLTGFNRAFTNWATVAVMGISSIGVIRTVMNKEKIQCACLGAVFDLPMTTVTIIEDLLMVLMAGSMLVIGP